MCKDLLLLLIYIIPLNIFLSCSRGVKGTLVKEKEDIPSLKSFQHRRQTAISSAGIKNQTKPISEKEGEGCVRKLPDEKHAERQAGLQEPWVTGVVQCPVGQNRKVTSQCIQQALQS